MLLHLHFIHEEKKRFAHLLLFIEPVLPLGLGSPLSPSVYCLIVLSGGGIFKAFLPHWPQGGL